jgi:peptidoglycan/LPS O-acetylase OafA/YrhL
LTRRYVQRLEELSLSTTMQHTPRHARVKPKAEPQSSGRVTQWMQTHVEANPSSGSPEGYLDGARGLAICAVVVIHVWGWSGRPPFSIFGHSLDFILARLGWAVDLFFLLSAFLLARPWFIAELNGAPPPSLRKYFRRRAGRLMPGYYVSLAVLLAAFVPLGAVKTQSLVGWLGFWNIGAHLAFVHNALPVSSLDFNGVNGVYWTLTIEFLFYLTLPFTIKLFMGRHAAVMPLAFLAASQLWVFLSLHSLGGLVHAYVRAVAPPTDKIVTVASNEHYMRSLLANQFPLWLFVFALGIALARLVVRYRAGVLRSPWIDEEIALAAIVVGVIGMVLVSYGTTSAIQNHPHSQVWPYYLGHPGYGVMLALIVFGLTFGPAWVRRPFETMTMRFLGWVSYGVYLYHLMVVRFIFNMTPLRQHLTEHEQFFVALALTWAIALPIATLSWMAIERPFLQRYPRTEPVEIRRRRWATVGVAMAALPIGAVVFGTHATDSVARPVSRGPLGTVHGAPLVRSLTGASTPAAASARGVIYVREQQFLTACGATAGETEGLSASSWGMTGSVFSCRDDQAATAMMATLPVWEAALNFDASQSGVPGVQLYQWVAPGDKEADPYHFHIRYRSGSRVIGMAISATTEADGRTAVRAVVAAATHRYAVSQ